MKNITLYKNISFYSMLLGFLIVGFSSCSSSQQAYNGDDGIYGSAEAKQEVVMVRDTRNDYYQNLQQNEPGASGEVSGSELGPQMFRFSLRNLLLQRPPPSTTNQTGK